MDFLDNYLPAEVLKHIRLETLALTKDTFVDQKQREHFSDLLYQVKLTNDQPGYVYFLFEHKSYPERFLTLKLLRYLVEIWELFHRQNRQAKTLPLIIPIVVYHGKPRGQAIPLSELVDLPAPDLAAYVPDFDLAFFDFSPAADEAIKGRILLQLFLNCLKAKNTPEAVERLVEIMILLARMDEDATSMHWMQKIFRYVLSVMDIDREVVQNIIKEHIPREKEDNIMTIAEQWKQEGRMEGRMEGRQTILNRQLSKRFGEGILSAGYEERLRRATPEQLDLWAEKLLDARSIEDVFRDN